MNVLSLFAGIGGLELGLERAGMTTVGQVELDPFCRQVLAKHWPEVPRHDDVRTAADWWLGAVRPPIHLICGGVPCQPFSSAGLRRGVADDRWLWPAMFDVVRRLRPRYVLVENVSTLLDDADAFGTILADLSEDGFDAEWSIVSACSVGAPHPRKRLFLLAYRPDGHVTDQGAATPTAPLRREPRGSGRLHRRARWLPEPDVDRVAHGLPNDVVRGPLHALGNAVVPQVAEHVGRLVMEFDAQREVAA